MTRFFTLQVLKWGFRENILKFLKKKFAILISYRIIFLWYKILAAKIFIFYWKRHNMWNFSEIWYTYSFYIYSTKIIRNQSIEHRKEKKRKESDGKWKTKKFLSFDWPVFRGQSFSWQEAKFSGYENKRTDRKDVT